MLLIKITRCTTTAANIKIVPQTLIIKGTSVNNSKTFISVQKNQQIEAINHKTLTFFIIITDLYVYYSIKAAKPQYFFTIHYYFLLSKNPVQKIFSEKCRVKR